jgi:oxygen-independent coproporphyrinogen III oxidase
VFFTLQPIPGTGYLNNRMMQNDLTALLQKYDVPLPRYTSYPTVPYWDFGSMSEEIWKDAVRKAYLNENGEICLYIHLPFCEELCTYCACNKRITKNHAVEEPYLEAVLREWRMYLELLPGTPVIREIHLGGGTPTFFSPANLMHLIRSITKDCKIADDHEFSVEVHPNYTSDDHLEALQSVGFNRISLGVQDFDPIVQFIINRPQSFEQTKHVIDRARSIGFSSINIDLIYGLPKQTLEGIEKTIQKVKELMPDRIAFYSYAHVPWKSKGQRRYTDDDVPKAGEKIAMYSLGNKMLTEMGFESIGMDHFALPTDKLLKAYHEGTLHRNFMGYTTTNHKLVIGLGASSISDTWTAFAQNEKSVEEYQARVYAGEFPLVNGHLLTGHDLKIRKYILDLMCKGVTRIDTADFDKATLDRMYKRLGSFDADGLICVCGYEIKVLPKGRLFIRNISAVFDAYLKNTTSQKPMFSKAI